MLIEDTEFVDSTMGGVPWKAGRFSHSLRLSLWSEHLGIRAGEVKTKSLYLYNHSVLKFKLPSKITSAQRLFFFKEAENPNKTDEIIG